MNDFEVKALDDISRSKVQRAARAAAKELEQLTGRPAFKAAAHDHAFWIESGGQIISLLVWREWKEEDCAWIGMAWSLPAFRRQGLYRKLFGFLVLSARERGFACVRAGLALNNEASQNAHREFGMRPVMVEMRLEKKA